MLKLLSVEEVDKDSVSLSIQNIDRLFEARGRVELGQIKLGIIFPSLERVQGPDDAALPRLRCLVREEDDLCFVGIDCDRTGERVAQQSGAERGLENTWAEPAER